MIGGWFHYEVKDNSVYMGTSSAAVSVDKNLRSLIPRCVLGGMSTAR